MNLFGKAKTAAPTAPSAKDSIMQLKNTLDTLEKRQSHLEKKIAGQLAEAKQKSARKDKKGALFCLKRKKMYEAEIDKIQGAQMTLTQQIMTLESATINMEVFKGMKTGANAMKQIHGAMNVDKVDDTMEDINEQIDLAKEISDVISQPVGDPLDEDDLLEELNELQEEELEAKMLDSTVPGIQQPATVAPIPDMPAAPTASIFPSVPQEDPTSAVQITGGDSTAEEMEELRRMEAEMMAA
jgi:charged multivesicular body protein 4